MNRRYNILIIILFCGFLGGIALMGILIPDKAFSEMENRNLRKFPELKYTKVASGRFMTEAESYVSDQMAFRDEWVGIKALCELLSGKKENNGIYFGKEDTLIRRVKEPDREQIEENLGDLHEFASQVEVPIYFGLIPTAASVWKEKLPAGAPSADEEKWIKWLYDRSDVENIDMVSTLKSHSDEEIYCRTDHHWTSLGAYYGANVILEAMNLKKLDMDNYTSREVSHDFLGTNYSSAGAWWSKPDTITVYVQEEGKEVISNFTGREEEGRLYVEEKLDTKNQYSYFLGGNQPLCVIKSQTEGPKLLVIRDSYADCLAPYLSERFSEVHLFDLRYNRLSPAEYVKEHDLDMVLILYNFENYITDENQFLLHR